MSILETFYILFKSDTSDVKKGTKEAKQSTDDLNNSLKSTGDVGEKIGDAFFGIAESFAKMAAAAVSVYAVVDALKSAQTYTNDLDLQSRSLGVSVETLDAYGNALKRTGGDAKSFAADLQNISQHTGLNPNQVPILFPALAQYFSHLGRRQGQLFADSLGISPSLLLLIRQGNAELQKNLALQQKLGVVSEKDRAISYLYNLSVSNLTHSFRNLFIEVDSKILPIFTKLIDKLIPGILYLQQHSNLVVGALIGIAGIAATLAIPFIAANVEIIAMVAAVGALIAAFAFLYDQFQSFQNGDDSFLTRAAHRWPAVAEIVTNAVHAIAGALELLKGVYEELFKELASGLDYVEGKIESLLDRYQNSQETKGENTGFLRKSFKGSLAVARQQLADANNSGLAAHTSNSILNSVSRDMITNVNVDNIDIQTQISDAPALAQRLKDMFTHAFWSASAYFDNGEKM